VIRSLAATAAKIRGSIARTSAELSRALTCVIRSL